jgi:hypothetical protein
MHPFDENIRTYSQYELRAYSVPEKLECLHSTHSALYKSDHFHYRRKQVYYTEITSNAPWISPCLHSENIPYFHLLVNDVHDNDDDDDDDDDDDNTRTNLIVHNIVTVAR